MGLGDGATWNESLPDNDTVANQIDDYDRDLRAGIRSRMALEHIWPSSQTATGQAGFHNYLTFQSQAAAPSLVAASGQVIGIYVVSSGSGTGAGYPIMVEHSDGTTTTLVTATKNILASLLTGVIPATNVNTGGTLQVVASYITTMASGSTRITADNTIPQITEGDEYMSSSITPTASGNQIDVDIVWNGSGPANWEAIALFFDTTAGAVACVAQRIPNATDIVNASLSYTMTATGTGAHAFSVRAGNASSGTSYLNGANGTAYYGGVLTSAIILRERKA